MIIIAKSGRDILQQQTYSLKTFFQTRRISWPITLSIALHLSFVAALIYASIKTLVHLPEPEEQGSIKAIMVNPAMFGKAKAETPSEPKNETPAAKQEAKAASKTENAAEAKTKPIVKPSAKAEPVKPKPLRKEPVKPKLVEKSVETPVREQRITESRPKENSQSLFSSHNESHSSSTNTVSSSTSAEKSAVTAPASTSAAASSSLGPKAISRGKPTYPPRAYALKIEGKVKVRYDVDSSGSVSNIEIVSAEPSNMFEREVKLAMRKWRYEPGRAAKGINSTFYFRMDGSTSVN